MNPFRRPLLTALAVTCALAGCLGPRTLYPPAHYVLAPTPTVQDAAATPLTLGVRPLATARPYGLPMAYVDAQGRMGFRNDESWTETPTAAVTRALTDALAESGRFADVGNAADMARPDLTLTGEIRHFHEDRAGNPPQAVFSVRIELRPARDAGVIWADTVEARAPLVGGSPAAFARAMGEAVSAAVTGIVAAINAADLPQS